MNSILKNELFNRSISGIILGFCFFGAYLHSAILFSFILFAILLIILFFEWPKLITTKGFKFWFISFFYPSLPILTLIFLNLYYRSVDILFPLYPFIVSWTGDTGAFIIGKLTGKHKICPEISPGKSWEGLIGGFFGIFIFNIIFLPGIKIFPFIIYLQGILPILLLSFLLTIVGFLGDIFVSFLKRKKDLKDTADLLPGHGGLLDRFDSVLFNSILILLIIIASLISQKI
ncbi:phosphatidate cytidylyltransferase [Candidatus Babeliales bacterium]|nr:phosphatidate cytidylyltransferase [Candidatus Babeliales bacterium]